MAGDDDLVIRTELVGGVGKYGRLLGWLYLGDAALSLNEAMIEEGYAWAYDGGTKQKDFEELREIRRAARDACLSCIVRKYSDQSKESLV